MTPSVRCGPVPTWSARRTTLRSTSATSSAPSISDCTAARCCVGPRGPDLHDAMCRVWPGPHMERAPDYATLHFRNIVCALDLGLHSRQVLCWAAGFAREFGAQLSIGPA